MRRTPTPAASAQRHLGAVQLEKNDGGELLAHAKSPQPSALRSAYIGETSSTTAKKSPGVEVRVLPRYSPRLRAPKRRGEHREQPAPSVLGNAVHRPTHDEQRHVALELGACGVERGAGSAVGWNGAETSNLDTRTGSYPLGVTLPR